MKTKKLLIGLTLAVFGMALISSTVLAGGKQRHRWEGVAIGVGAAILGHAIFQSHKADQSPQAVYAEPEPAPRYHHPPRHCHGYWEWQDLWVPPTYEKIWNPGHYNRKGHWMPGHWMTVQTTDGHWTKERVWVANR
jgi:hypothetical protein